MQASTFIFRKDQSRTDMLAKLGRFIHKLPADKPWQVTVEPYKKLRSNAQNAFLWGVCYPTILSSAGEELGGWTAHDLHDYFLGEHFGWETIEGFGKKRMKAIRRSSKLSTVEFMDYIGFIQQKAAELGIYIQDPNEDQQ